MKVDTHSLRTLCETLLNHLEQSGGREIELSNDYYWHIPAEQRHDMNRQPTELSIGQLSDDWQELQRILTGESEPIGYALVWLASILCDLGEASRG